MNDEKATHGVYTREFHEVEEERTGEKKNERKKRPPCREVGENASSQTCIARSTRTKRHVDTARPVFGINQPANDKPTDLTA